MDGALPGFSRPVRRSRDRAKRFGIVAMILGASALTLWLLDRGTERSMAYLPVVLAVLVAIPLLAPRVIAMVRLPAMHREALSAGQALEAGDAAGARARFEALCRRAHPLGPYSAFFGIATAVSTLEAGDAHRALAIVDAVLESGWLDAGRMRARFRTSALATRAMIQLALDDADGARATAADARGSAPPGAGAELALVEALLAARDGRWSDTLRIAGESAEAPKLPPIRRRNLARLASLAARHLEHPDDATRFDEIAAGIPGGSTPTFDTLLAALDGAPISARPGSGSRSSTPP